ncbi:hypothetical protein J8F10_13865 [Gemmata sp. G18]|uniref:Uncharacterized protein n=1 Tax=Gemmata palustris TaxID=2822762 RepID=A0ABS5BSH8_9BACT|nr:hypothetical protein [Gemmata palustris]MBP3956367.1 hypothetical protein [Gemmata palustris]
MSAILVCMLVAVAHVTHAAPAGECTRVVLVAATWEEAEALLGMKSKSHALIMIGSLKGGGLTRFYMSAGVTMWRDPASDLIIGISTPKPTPAESEQNERAAARFREVFGMPEGAHTAPMPREVNR